MLQMSSLSRCAYFGFASLVFASSGVAMGVGDTTPPVFIHQPVLLDNPNVEVPLSAMIGLETDEPVRVELSYWDGAQHTGPFQAEPDFKMRHAAVPVLSVHPGSTYRITVTVYDAAGNATQAPAPLVWNTPALPPGFPPLDITVSDPSRMESGVTLICPRESRANHSWLVMLDAEGEVVWYYVAPPERRLGDVRRTPAGNILAILNRDTIVEFDMLGNDLGEWKAIGVDSTLAPGVIPVQTDSFHHEVIELPDTDPADLAAISVELRDYPNYPADENDLSQTNPMTTVAGDVIVEFKRDGTVLREYKLLDILDPYRISYDALGGFWNPHYGITGTADWSHANAVILDPSDNSYIVSVRSQETVVKFSRDTGQLIWIMSDPAGWQAPWSSKLLNMEPGQPEFNWQYHQHAPMLTPGGGLIMFDNGNGRAVAPAPELPDAQRTSRVVEVSVDTTMNTVKQEWTYHRNVAGESAWYSRFLGDADMLTDTVLVTDGGKTVAGAQLTYARVAEVTHTTPPEKVFEVIVRDPNPLAVGAVGWTIYRSERLVSGVYPQ